MLRAAARTFTSGHRVAADAACRGGWGLPALLHAGISHCGLAAAARTLSSASAGTAPVDPVLSKVERRMRVRYAPSPTGSLHLGGLRTALYNYLLAKRHGGDCLLRIEDTDRTRLVEGATQQLQRDLAWAGIQFDEGPGALGGDCGPYVQSERLPIYQEHVDRLLATGHAYRCFCTPKRLEDLRARQAAKGSSSSIYDRLCMHLSAEEVAARRARGEPSVVRMRMPEGSTTVNDAVRGAVTFNNAGVDDQVLLKTDGFPTYHLANVVDDHLMRITHVIRGEEWLPSAPKHVALYAAFGWEAPVFAHLPLLLRADGSKLSKRFKDASLDHYVQLGYLPEALVNFVALLGWTPDVDEANNVGDGAGAGIAGAGSSSTAAATASSSAAAPLLSPAVAAAAPAVPASDGGVASPSTSAVPANAAAALKALLADTRTKKGKLAVTSAKAMGFGVDVVAPTGSAAGVGSGTTSSSSSSAATSSSATSSSSDSLPALLTLPQLCSLFSLDRVGHSGSAVDPAKLAWLHSQYWKLALKHDEDRLVGLVLPRITQVVDAFAAAGEGAAGTAAALDAALSEGVGFGSLVCDPRTDRDAVRRALRITHGHPCLISELPHKVFFVWARPDLTTAKAAEIRASFWVSNETAAAAATEAAAAAAAAAASAVPAAAAAAAAGSGRAAKTAKQKADTVTVPSALLLRDTAAAVESWSDVVCGDTFAVNVELKKLIATHRVAMRDLFLPMRFALSGSLTGPGVADQVVALGKGETLLRLRAACEGPPAAS